MEMPFSSAKRPDSRVISRREFFISCFSTPRASRTVRGEGGSIFNGDYVRAASSLSNAGVAPAARAAHFAGVTRRMRAVAAVGESQIAPSGPCARRGCARSGCAAAAPPWRPSRRRARAAPASGRRARRRTGCPSRPGTGRRVERHAGRRDRRHPVLDRLLHAGLVRALVDLGAAIVDAVADHRPAVVLAGLRNVDLVAAARAVLVLPQFAGLRMQRRALRVAVAVAPDFRLASGSADERIVRRHRAVGRDAHDLAEMIGEVLRLVAIG